MGNTLRIDYEAKLTWTNGKEFVFNESFDLDVYHNCLEQTTPTPEDLVVETVADARVKSAKKGFSTHVVLEKDPEFDKFVITKLSVTYIPFNSEITVFDKELGFQNYRDDVVDKDKFRTKLRLRLIED